MRGNNISHHRQPRITPGWTLVESHFKSPCFRIKLLHVQFPANLTTTCQWISRINLIRCLQKNSNYFNLLCLKLGAGEVPHAAPPAPRNNPPSPPHLYTLPVGTYLHPLFCLSFARSLFALNCQRQQEGFKNTIWLSAKVRFLTRHVSGLWAQKPQNSHLSTGP